MTSLENQAPAEKGYAALAVTHISTNRQQNKEK